MLFRDSDEVQRRYRVNRSTIYRWMDDPDIAFPHPVKIGSRILWRDEDLAAFDDRLSTQSDASQP